MVNHIAYPDELLNDKKIEEFYEKVSFKNCCFLRLNVEYDRLNFFSYIFSWRYIRISISCHC